MTLFAIVAGTRRVVRDIRPGSLRRATASKRCPAGELVVSVLPEGSSGYALVPVAHIFDVPDTTEIES